MQLSVGLFVDDLTKFRQYRNSFRTVGLFYTYSRVGRFTDISSTRLTLTLT